MVYKISKKQCFFLWCKCACNILESTKCTWTSQKQCEANITTVRKTETGRQTKLKLELCGFKKKNKKL